MLLVCNVRLVLKPRNAKLSRKKLNKSIFQARFVAEASRSSSSLERGQTLVCPNLTNWEEELQEASATKQA